MDFSFSPSGRGGPVFNFVFPFLVAALLWGGLWLRDRRLHGVFAARTA